MRRDGEERGRGGREEGREEGGAERKCSNLLLVQTTRRKYVVVTGLATNTAYSVMVRSRNNYVTTR